MVRVVRVMRLQNQGSCKPCTILGTVFVSGLSANVAGHERTTRQERFVRERGLPANSPLPATAHHSPAWREENQLSSAGRAAAGNRCQWHAS
jgi:hypothetical protein